MRAVVQRVSQASVRVDGQVVAQIGKGLVVLAGIRVGDSRGDADYLADKILNLRIFEDQAGKLNLSALDVGAELLVVSQFTLYGDARRGRRPSFTEAAPPEQAKPLFDYFLDRLRLSPLRVEEGVFGAIMEVEIHNQGPVTIILDSPGREGAR
ncbi:MAG: D-aminoacyl-tRNA deacylase [candidate division KSB1 bacterium]|nr:D-aminoacyl-tRNA deacylase [candidate division KSB1 bacterium]